MKLLVMADDLTGALDTGVKLSKEGISTLVALDYRELNNVESHSYDVIVIDTNTRHVKAEEARKKIESIIEHFKNMKINIDYIYKKTDSALRGNVGSELAGLLYSSDFNELHFIPALPDFKRVTIEGIHYIDGIKLEDSIFSKDPFEPVRKSSVKEIIRSQEDVEVINSKECLEETATKKIIVYDAIRNEDILNIANCLYEEGRLKILAGCAGFVNVLPKIIDFPQRDKERTQARGSLLAVCGSVNPITRAQVEHSIEDGFASIMVNRERLERLENYWETDEGRVIVSQLTAYLRRGQDTIVYLDSLFNEIVDLDMEERFKIAEGIGSLVKILIEENLVKNVLVTGGDTIRSLCNVAGVKTLIPNCEIIEGIVKSEMIIDDNSINIISKSGGFGDKAAISEVAGFLKQKELII